MIGCILKNSVMALLLMLFGMMPLAMAYPIVSQSDRGVEFSSQSDMAITQYQLSAMPDETVYGLFDLGEKASIRLILPGMKGGQLMFHLHGRQYEQPILNHYQVMVQFEDITGRVFQETIPFQFESMEQTGLISWFEGVDTIAGTYGDQVVICAIPYGASAVQFVALPHEPTYSPNGLLGYISRIHFEQMR